MEVSQGVNIFRRFSRLKTAPHSKLRKCLLVVGFVALFTTEVPRVEAKDLSGRFGLGATDIGPSFNIVALSLDWQLSSASFVEANFGLDTLNSRNAFSLSARYGRNLYIEDELLFFLFLGGGLLTLPGENSNAAGYMVESGVGSKFFFSGLPNLGFHVGTGFRLESPSQVRIRSVLFGGFHYYF